MEKIVEDSSFEEIYKSSNAIEPVRFTEMSVHCLASDQYSIIVIVGSTIDRNKSSGSRIEHDLPHAHVWSADKKFHSRFQIINTTCPKTPKELCVVDVENDAPLDSIAEEIIKWANDKPKRCFQKGDTTNWDAMRSSWHDIQEIVSFENNEQAKEKILKTRLNS